MRWIVVTICLSASICLACGGSPKTREIAHNTGPSAQSLPPSAMKESSAEQTGPISQDNFYSTIDTELIPGIKRSLTVRLYNKVSEEALRSIALDLKAKDSTHYDRTFITYYLPGMQIGSGAWATTHFNPTLEVRILGLTDEEQRTLIQGTPSSSQETIGRWIVQGPVSYTISLYKKDGSIYLETQFKDGSHGIKQMRERRSSRGRRFEAASGSDTGDHYILDALGNLQIRDSIGLIDTARPVH